jgi:prolipoprotein diacylglyceryltransferase
MLDPIIQLGPFTIPVYLLALAASFFIAMWLMRRDMDRAGANGKQIVDILWTAFVIAILVYRFGGMLLNPLEVLRSPFQAFMAVPAPYMAWVGILAGVMYAGWNIYKSGQWQAVGWLRLLNGMMPSLLVGLAVYQLFTADLGKPTQLPWGIEVGQTAYHPLHVYRGLALLVIGLALRSGKLQPEFRFGWALFGGGVAVMIMSFAAFPDVKWAGLTGEQWIAVAASLVGLLTLWRQRA